jgi:hypothetical protein
MTKIYQEFLADAKLFTTNLIFPIKTNSMVPSKISCLIDVFSINNNLTIDDKKNACDLF